MHVKRYNNPLSVFSYPERRNSPQKFFGMPIRFYKELLLSASAFSKYQYTKTFLAAYPIK